jgi:lipopolysaccharide/colanic/teichoic acid biosynthesis glycosyltransferase
MMVTLLGASLLLGKVHADYVGDYDFTSSSRFFWVISHAVIAVLVGYAAGLPDRVSWSSVAIAAVAPSLLLAVVQTSVGEFFVPRFFLLVSIPVNAAVFSGAAFISRTVRRTSAKRERVVLLCAPEEAQRIQADVDYHTEIPCSIVATFDIAASSDLSGVLETIRRHGPTTVVYSADTSQDPKVIAALTEIHLWGLRVRDLTGFYDEFVGKVPIRELASTAILFDHREIQHPFYSRVSRVLDVLFSVIALLVLAAILPLVWLGNALGNRGHFFFAQERVGKGMKLFNIWKLRTMIPGDSTNQWTSPDDPRVTTFGRFLRATHLDELPQAWNILRGELALVGPRPEQPHYVEELSATIPFYTTRHLVTPGLTGWAQVNYPYGSNHKDAYEKLQYEFWYLRHQQLSLDLKIIARTIRHVFRFQGR